VASAATFTVLLMGEWEKENSHMYGLASSRYNLPLERESRVLYFQLPKTFKILLYEYQKYFLFINIFK
jgi:hypothetical protein